MRSFALLGALALLTPLGAAGGPPLGGSESKAYVGFGLVSCGPPGSGADGGVGGACFDLGFLASRVTIRIDDAVFAATGGSYRFVQFMGPATPETAFCDATSAPVPRHAAPSIQLQVTILDPARAALACGVGAAGVLGSINVTSASGR